MLPVAYGNCTEKWNNKTDFYSHIRPLVQYSIDGRLKKIGHMINFKYKNGSWHSHTSLTFLAHRLEIKSLKEDFLSFCVKRSQLPHFSVICVSTFEGTELRQHSLEWNLSSGEVSSSSSLLLSSPSPLIIRFAFVDLTSCPTYLSLAIYSHEK